MSSQFQMKSPEDQIRELVSLERRVLSEEHNIAKIENGMSNKMKDLMSAGSLADVNKIIWPFQFSTGFMKTSADKLTDQKTLRITQEAGFVALKIIKTVFERVEVEPDVFELRYVNSHLNEQVNDLRISWQDSSSDRYFQQSPMSINHIGDAFFPTFLRSRPFIFPSGSIVFQLDAGPDTKEYYTNITLIGYRIRVEDTKGLFSLVTE